MHEVRLPAQQCLYISSYLSLCAAGRMSLSCISTLWSECVATKACWKMKNSSQQNDNNNNSFFSKHSYNRMCERKWKRFIHSKTKVRDIKTKARNIKAKHQNGVRKDCYMKGSLLKDVYVYSCRDMAENKSTKLGLLNSLLRIYHLFL